MDKIKIGEITGAVGLKGEIKVYDFGEDPLRYSGFEYLYIGDEKYARKGSRVQKNLVVLLLEGIDDRNKAEKLRGESVYIDENQLPKLPEGTYYIRDILGFDVVSDEGVYVGVLHDVIKNTAQPVYAVKKKDGKMAYIPGVDEFILKTDIEGKKIIVKLIEGMID